MKRTLKGKQMAIDDMLDIKGQRVRGVTPCYISVDIEATGPTPGHYSMYELGASVVGGEGKFERKLTLLPEAKFLPTSLRAVGTTKRKLLARGDLVSPKIAMRAFAKWALTMADGDKLIFVANNAPFDWMFVAWYFEEFRVKNPFGYSALDMKAYFMGLTKCSWKGAILPNMARYAGMKFTALPHRALDDALIQSEIFSALLRH